MSTVHRVYNFAAGPAVLPVPVLEEIQRDLDGAARRRHVDPGNQPSIEAVRIDPRAGGGGHPRAGRHSRRLPRPVSAGRRQHAVLDGADEPAHRRAQSPTTSIPGSWAEKAIKEAKKVGKVNVAATTKADNYSRIPRRSELKLTPAPRTCTSPRTTRSREPSGSRCPMSATLRSSTTPRRTCSAVRSTSQKHALIYAGAQKNMGPAGVTIVIIRDDLLARSQPSLPTMLNYAVHAENKSLYNTPPAFAVYALGLVMKWLRQRGRAAGDREGQRTQGREVVCRNRSNRLLPRHRAEGQPLADERHVQARRAKSWRKCSSRSRPPPVSTG